jgi:EpsI family protein
MKPKSIAWVLTALMCSAPIAGVVARPDTKVSDALQLETAVPTAFAGWTEVKETGAQVRDPAAEELLRRLYSQLLVRTYVNKDGQRIMLSIAYGSDQRGGLQAHLPEVCYPAQGFTVDPKEKGSLVTAFGEIPVVRLTTRMGRRHEPVTYWLTIGDEVNTSAFVKRAVEMRFALTGQIPDGLLFRVSSIDGDPQRAFAVQQTFVTDMMGNVTPENRRRLAGLKPAAAG